MVVAVMAAAVKVVEGLVEVGMVEVGMEGVATVTSPACISAICSSVRSLEAPTRPTGHPHPDNERQRSRTGINRQVRRSRCPTPT